jgi:hypothetical protein
MSSSITAKQNISFWYFSHKQLDYFVGEDYSEEPELLAEQDYWPPRAVLPADHLDPYSSLVEEY